MRLLDQDVLDYFISRRHFSYAHLIKFERPILSDQELNVSDREYAYITDASVDLYFNDPRVDSSPENLAVKYKANRVIEVPAIVEYSEARATSIDLKLDANAIGANLADTCIITGSGTAWELNFQTISVYDKGFVEGDKISLAVDGNTYELEILGFPEDNKMNVSGELIEITDTVFIELESEELVSILMDKSAPEYASFINREVQIYKVFFDEDNVRIGTPYYLYKGIIQDVNLEDTESSITLNWTLNSHWGDFAEVRGRITSDEFHRALDERGIPQPKSAIRTDYAYDKGFIHADTAINIEANYTVQVEKQDIKAKKGFFGIGAKVKVKKYFVDEIRQTELDFNLQGKTLDVVYGVRPVEGSPIFADTDRNNSNKVYVAYSLCEGEVGGIYDLLVQDQTLICSNEADFDVRSSQTPENTIDVVCYGRADRGDVLEGVRSTNTTVNDFFGTNYINYWNEQSLSLLTNYEGFDRPVGTSASPSSVGVRHENSITLDTPIDMVVSFYAGRSNQKAAPNLVDIAINNNFKIQSDYWDNPNGQEYWGPNHRLLDTAYLVVEYTISESETTIPNMKAILKGKFIQCYNYDNSYQHYSKAAGEDSNNFNEGDYVDLYDGDDVLLDSSVRIVNKFVIVDENGITQPRFALEREPSLDYTDGVPSITKFYMKDTSDNTWTLVTYNHQESSGTVTIGNTINIVDVDTGGDTVGIEVSPTAPAIIGLTPTVNSPVDDVSGSFSRSYPVTFRVPLYEY